MNLVSLNNLTDYPPWHKIKNLKRPLMFHLCVSPASTDEWERRRSPEKLQPISGSQLLKYGDMVICMANGSSALVGKASYYNETTDSIATIGAFCGIYRSDKKIVRWLLQTNKYKRVIHRSCKEEMEQSPILLPNDILGLSFIIPKQEPSIVELLQGFWRKTGYRNIITS